MNRRTILRSLLTIPGARALVAQEPVKLPPAAKPAPSETPRTPTINADSLAETTLRTFKPEQFSALHRLGEIIAPSSKETPGANEANAAQFLDFLIGQSSADRQNLYRSGLDALNHEAQRLHRKPFSAATEAEASPILAPLRVAWSFTEPSAVLVRFLLTAKEDLLRATFNSREYISVVSQRRRNAGGTGQYWYPVD